MDYTRYIGKNGEKPENAILVLHEGGLMGRKFKAPLYPALAAMGVSAAEWDRVTDKLSRTCSALSKTPTIKAIEELNGAIFIAKGCFATFSEFSWGQKAMTVYSLEEWNSMHPPSRAASMQEVHVEAPEAPPPAAEAADATGAEPAEDEAAEQGEEAEGEAGVEEEGSAAEEEESEGQPDEPKGAGAVEVARVLETEAERDGAGQQSAAEVKAKAARDWLRGAEQEIVSGAQEPFVIRNLDTGEIISIPMTDGTSEDLVDPELVRQKLSFGTISQNPEAWQALKEEAQGVLEKLASKATYSFRSYQLCVWQRRYVYATDDALVYFHLRDDEELYVQDDELKADNIKLRGDEKRIPYSSIEFVGSFDTTQFIIKCASRAYTFDCPTPESRTRWIKNISRLAGCSASTQVCHKTESLVFNT